MATPFATGDEQVRAELPAMLVRLRPYAMKMARDRDAADDLLQQTAMKALAGSHQFSLGTNLVGWMARILRNEHISAHRRTKRFVIPMDLTEIPQNLVGEPEQQTGAIFIREVGTAMNALPASQRELVVPILEGASYEDLASSLGISVGTVKSRLWRARQTLRELAL